MSTTVTAHQREAFWDNAKYFLIILVVTGHMIQPYTGHDHYWPRYLFSVIYTFHMPLFIFVSGLFGKSVIQGSRFRIERVISFLLLYVIYKVIRMFLLYILWDSALILDLFVEDGLPWYLLTMAFWMCMTYLVKNVRPAIMLAISICLAFLVGFSNATPDLLAYLRTLIYWPFFLLGFYLDREKLTGFLNRRWIRIIGVIGFLVFLFLVWRFLDTYSTFGSFFTGRNSYATVLETWDGFRPAYRFLYYPYLVLVGICFLSIVPRKRVEPFSTWGSRTLQIFILHRLILYVLDFAGIYGLVPGAFPQEKYQTLVFIALSVGLAMLLSLKIWSRPFDWLMRQKYTFLFAKGKEHDNANR